MPTVGVMVDLGTASPCNLLAGLLRNIPNSKAAMFVSRFVSRRSEYHVFSGVLGVSEQVRIGLKTQVFEKEIYTWNLTRMVS